jgi:hypothetical protein
MTTIYRFPPISIKLHILRKKEGNQPLHHHPYYRCHFYHLYTYFSSDYHRPCCTHLHAHLYRDLGPCHFVLVLGMIYLDDAQGIQLQQVNSG